MRIAGVVGARLHRHDLGLAEAPAERGEDRLERLRPGDDRQPAARPDDGRGAADPALEQPVRPSHAHRASAYRAWRGRAPALKGGFMIDEVEAAVGEPGRRARLAGQRDVGGDERDAVAEMGVVRDGRALFGEAEPFPARSRPARPGAADSATRPQGRRRRRRRRNRRAARQSRTAPRPPASSHPCRRDGRRPSAAPARNCRGGTRRPSAAGSLRPAWRPALSRCLISLPMPASARMRARPVDLVGVDHDAARQDADRAVEHAHVLVGHEMPDAGIAQQRFDEGDDDGVVGADEFFHGANSQVCASKRRDGELARDNAERCPRSRMTCSRTLRVRSRPPSA